MKKLIVAVAVAVAMAFGASAEGENETVPSVILNQGDSARLEAVFARATAGQPIVIGALGGSITAGTGASSSASRWTDLVANWFVSKFPQATVTRKNAGIGATGSLIGAHRIATDVAPGNPDFVTVDFSVNDNAGDQAAETMDSCIRQLLQLPKDPAVMLVSFVNHTGASAQEDHLRAAQNYGVPQISVKNAVWPDIEAGRRTWASWSNDDVHPNNEGHAFTAKLVTDFLDERYAAWQQAGALTPTVSKTLPEPLSSTFLGGAMVKPLNLTVVKNDGFAADGTTRKGWSGVIVATEPGATFTFTTTHPTLSLIHWRVHGNYGRAQVTVDGEEVCVLEGWFDETWGGYACPTVIYRDSPGLHVVTVTVLDEKAAESNGHRFELCPVLLSGGAVEPEPEESETEEPEPQNPSGEGGEGGGQTDPESDGSSFSPDQYAFHAKLRVDGYQAAETLEDMPVLVRLSANFVRRFQYGDCGTDGADIRFSDGEGRLYPHEIDTWNPTARASCG